MVEDWNNGFWENGMMAVYRKSFYHGNQKWKKSFFKAIFQRSSLPIFHCQNLRVLL
jgi:hypothetical protein